MKLLSGSCVFLAIIAAILGYKQYGNWIIALISLFIVVIPALYSLIPLFEEQRHVLNKSKNRLTDITFTDRHDDFEKIVRKLVFPDHVLEIKGRNAQCGKTWLAKRLCDYINFPKDEINAEIDIKCPYKRAFYLDMKEYSEKELNAFFKQELINPNVVLIFDHVTDLNLLLTKQSLYHFQLVYILKDSEISGFLSHTVSDFKAEYIGELQQKIRKNYPGLSDITEDEIKILHKLTNGNIGKITALLSEERCIRWIKDIGNDVPTEYDEKLWKIQATLYVGRYQDAKKELIQFKNEYKDSFQENNDLFYKFILMSSDCEHLLNRYDDALNILSIAENIPYRLKTDPFKIELYRAHYLKHLWKCDDALTILQNLKGKSYNAIVDSLGILLAKYFIDDLHVPMSESNALEEFLNFYMIALMSNLQHSNDETLKLKRCTPIYNFYKMHPIDSTQLIEQIDEVISTYSAQHNRLLANAFFIKGELLRLYEDYENAIINYQKCLTVTIDNNIIVQVNLMVYYLEKCKHIHTTYELMDMAKILEICQNNHYAERVYQRIRCIELHDSNSKEIQECFEHRIMPIL